MKGAKVTEEWKNEGSWIAHAIKEKRELWLADDYIISCYNNRARDVDYHAEDLERLRIYRFHIFELQIDERDHCSYDNTYAVVKFKTEKNSTYFHTWKVTHSTSNLPRKWHQVTARQRHTITRHVGVNNTAVTGNKEIFQVPRGAVLYDNERLICLKWKKEKLL